MALVGYARVSMAAQPLDPQINFLKAAGCERVFAEAGSGVATDDQEQLDEALEFVGKGDVLVVLSLDRLARSQVDLRTIVRRLQTKLAHLRCLRGDTIDTTIPDGWLILEKLLEKDDPEDPTTRLH